MAELLHPSGQREIVHPRDGRRFTLEELQGYVQGYIEAVQLADGRTMWVNETGKLTGLPLNIAASELYAVNRAWPDPIVGPALVCTKAETGDDEEGR